ncbi:MAG TPA: DUF4382 domain-containing protein [Ferruginibacter sp.]|nr:DUF4382 domain-containing protein [Ferruginibacter sp.]
MKNRKTPWFLFILITAAVTIFSCQKEARDDSGNIPAGQSRLEVMLTDDPSQLFDSIFINIQKLEVKTEDSTGAEHWDVLTIRPGVYNILRFRNGLDTLLASGNIPAGEIKKIRLTLGTGNYVMLNGVSIPLDLNSSDAVITIDVHHGSFDSTGIRRFRIWLDMDGHGSIRIKSNGRLELKLRLGHFCHGNSGEIEGEIQPGAALPALVMAVSGTDTLTAIPEHDGEFKIRGIRSTTATVIIKPSNGYKDSVINNVPVRLGEDTHLGRIVLHR